MCEFDKGKIYLKLYLFILYNSTLIYRYMNDTWYSEFPYLLNEIWYCAIMNTVNDFLFFNSLTTIQVYTTSHWFPVSHLCTRHTPWTLPAILSPQYLSLSPSSSNKSVTPYLPSTHSIQTSAWRGRETSGSQRNHWNTDINLDPLLLLVLSK